MADLAALRPASPAVAWYEATIVAATATSATYTLEDNPAKVHGPALLPWGGVEPGSGPDVHDHAASVPPAGAPCLVIVFAGRWDDAYLIPFAEEV